MDAKTSKEMCYPLSEYTKKKIRAATGEVEVQTQRRINMDTEKTDRRIAKVQLVMEALLLGLTVELPLPLGYNHMDYTTRRLVPPLQKRRFRMLATGSGLEDQVVLCTEKQYWSIDDGKRLSHFGGQPEDWTIGDLVTMAHFMGDDEVWCLSDDVRRHRNFRITDTPKDGEGVRENADPRRFTQTVTCECGWTDAVTKPETLHRVTIDCPKCGKTIQLKDHEE